MIHSSAPSTSLALLILVSVVVGTLLLIAVAFIRRWQQIRYARYVHTLQRQYRPIVAKVLSGIRSPSAIEALRELSVADLDLLLDPLFSRRKLTERQRVFLQALCSELGLITLWQRRTANGNPRATPSEGDRTRDFSTRAPVSHILRAKSIRNLGMLRYRPSWMLLANTLDDRHPDIQLVALRSLAALGGLEGFQVLRDRLHAVVQGKASFPPVKSLLAAMSTYDLSCVQALVPSLRHTNRQIRLNTAQVLQVMVYRESVHQRRFDHTMDLLTPPMVELVLSKLAVDISAEIRARAAEILVHLTDPRTFSVLHNLLLDPQWSVRLSTLRALTRTHRASAPLHKEIRDFLRDPHWQVREAAIKILISLGQEEKQEIYNYYLNSPDPGVREQIAMMIQRTGLLPVLVEDYCAGVKGVHALVVEELASHSASVGLPGVLRHLAPGNRQRFMERFRPVAQSRKTLQENMGPAMEGTDGVHQALEYPPHLAA